MDINETYESISGPVFFALCDQYLHTGAQLFSVLLSSAFLSIIYLLYVTLIYMLSTVYLWVSPNYPLCVYHLSSVSYLATYVSLMENSDSRQQNQHATVI